MVEKEDWRSVIDLVTNAKQVVSSVQDAARKLADYAKFTKKDNSTREDLFNSPICSSNAYVFKLLDTRND